MRIMTVCGHGLGSSFILEMKVKEVMRDLKIDAEVGHTDLSSISPNMADVFICSKDLASSINADNVITVSNIIDKTEIKKQIETYFKNH